MILYIIRHAWAGDPDGTQYPDDGSRPLTSEGRKRFKCVVKALADRGFAPAIVATSPLVRCRQTADIVAEKLDDSPQVVELEALEPGSNLQALVEWTSSRNEDEIAWVGHAPDVSQLTAALVCQASGWLRFSKGAVAAIHFDNGFGAGKGELHWLVTAKILGC